MDTKTCGMCRKVKSLDAFYRQTSSHDGHAFRCKLCTKANTLAWIHANPEKHVAHGMAWEKKYPKKATAKNKRHRQKHPEQHRANVAKWCAKYPEKHNAINARYQKRHPDRNAAKTARRRATKRDATPAWANQSVVDATYTMAAAMTKLTGVKHHVDHIVPLRSKIVCGLHWEGNFEVIPAVENISKSNRYWPDMPENENRNALNIPSN